MDDATDPVCGMRVNPLTAAAMIVHDGHTHYFCSTGCQDKFEADPGRYGDTHAATDGAAEYEPLSRARDDSGAV